MKPFQSHIFHPSSDIRLTSIRKKLLGLVTLPLTILAAGEPPAQILHTMQSASQLASSPRPTLTTLPSELRKLILSYLTPSSVDEIKPGCKRHLQSANLTHSSLREWAPEYLFEDMTLTHVLPGASSNLEIFAVTPENRHLLKHVRHIIVKVGRKRSISAFSKTRKIEKGRETSTNLSKKKNRSHQRYAGKSGCPTPSS